MDVEIDRLRAITSSSLARCRNPQFTFHFRAEMPQFNVPGVGIPNSVALKFKCANSLRSKRPTSIKNDNSGSKTKVALSSTWKIRHPEMRPGCRIAVPIAYDDGNWARDAIISLVFIVHSKRHQRVAYSNGEIALLDDLRDERFALLMQARHERSSEDLKTPVIVHLLIDVWDVTADHHEAKVEVAPMLPLKRQENNHKLMFQRVQSTVCPEESDECCVWPETADFLIEIADRSEDSSSSSNSRQDSLCGASGDACDGQCCKFDENANLLLVPAYQQQQQHQSVQFFCHQSILANASAAFEKMFSDQWTKDANVLRIRSVGTSAVEMFLNFIYNGQLIGHPADSSKNEDGDSRVEFDQIVQVVSLAARYDVDKLRSYCDSLLTDRYLNSNRAAYCMMIAERYELPLLGQAALSLLSLSLDEQHLQALIIGNESKHLLTTVIGEARKKHMFCTVINPC